MALDFKQYVLANFFPSKILILPKLPSTIVTTIDMDPHMVVIPIYVGKNLVEDVLLDGRSIINIITDSFKKRLGLHVPSPSPYNFKMVDQSLTKPL